MEDTEMVKEPEAEQVEETPEKEEVIVEEPEKEEEEFDKERAMATIKNLRKFEKDAAKLQKQIDAFKLKEAEDKKAKLSEIDRLKLEQQEVSQKYAALLLDTQRTAAAKKVGLPDIFADRINGDTPEEMEEDAKLLLSAIPTQKSNIGVTNPGPNATGQQETKEQTLRRLGLTRQ